MKAFEFATATRIVFGDGVSEQLPKLAAAYPPSLLIVTGSQPARPGSASGARHRAKLGASSLATM